MSAKMQQSQQESKSNFTTLELTWKNFYKDTLIGKGISQEQEGSAIWRDQATIQQYCSQLSPRNLTIPLAVKSEIADDIIGWMAQQRGGYYTSRVGELNGTKKDELSTILKAAAEITAFDSDPTVCHAQFDIIMQAAKRGMEECS
jgi:hypothetical protein